MNPAPHAIIVANGTPYSISMPCNLKNFLEQLNLLPRSVVVEHNGHPVAPSDFSNHPVHDGDQLEIVKIVAGG